MSQPRLLWRTIFRSPCVKWILPGNIGRHDRVDVAFVGESHVEIKEWDRDTESLRSIAVVADLPAKIISAQMLGERKASYSVSNCHSGMDIDYDHGHATPALPPQILILALSNATMVFLAITQEERQVKVCRSAQPTLAAEPLEQVGWLLVTEPTCRAIALAAIDKNLTIFSLSDTSDPRTTLNNLTRQSLNRASSMTIMCMEFINWPREDSGRICLVICGRLENRVVFRAYVWDPEASLCPDNIQKFDSKLVTDHGVPNMLVRLLRPGHFMLVCDRIIAVYHLSTDGNWEQANSSPLYRPDTEDGTFRPSNQGVSPSVPCWTNWARPTRRPGWRNEVIYLAREDGSLRYVELRSAHKNQLRIHSTDDAGQLNSSIDSAFAVLDVEQNRLEDGVLPNDALDGKFAQGYPDVFLVVGDLSDGGIFEIGVRDGIEYLDRPYDPTTFTRAMAHVPQQRDRLTNWAPVSDATLVRSVSRDRSTNGAASRNVYVACGRSPHGSIAELRFGLDACTRDISLYHDFEADLKGVRDMWILHLDKQIPHILLSFPWRSVWFGLETEGMDRLTGGLRHLPDCDLDQPTIAAAVLEAGPSHDDDEATSYLKRKSFVVQVTPSRVHLLSLDRKSAMPQQARHEDICRSPVACIDAERHLLLLATESGRQRALVVHLLAIHGDKLLSDSKPLMIDFDATCALFLNEGHSTLSSRKTKYKSLVLVGDDRGALHIFELLSNLRLHRIGVFGVSEMDHDSPGEGIESVSVIKSRSDDTYLKILSGHRNGRISIYQIDLTSQSLEFEQRALADAVHLGTQSVHLLEYGISASSILARCGSSIYSLDFAVPEAGRPRITSVYFTDPNNPAFQHGSLSALCQVQEAPESRLKHRLIGLSSSIFLCGLIVDQVPKPLPVRRPIPGTPGIVDYFGQMDMLVAGTTVNYVDEDACKRYAISELLCIPSPRANLRTIKLEDDVSDMLRFQYPPGERLHCVAQQPLNDDRCVIVAGSSIRYEVETDRGVQCEERGQLRWFNVKERHGVRSIECVKESKEDLPVKAICDTEDGAFLYASGSTLLRRRWNASEKYWPKETIGAPFPSPIIAIRQYQSRLAYVTTSHHSTSMTALYSDFERLVVHSDAVGGLCNLPLLTDSRTPQVLFSSKDGLISGLKVPSDDDDDISKSSSNGSLGQRNSTSGTSTFEAQLPTSVNQILRADIRPLHKRQFETPAGVLEDNILGTALDGSLFAFTILDDDGWRILRFIQNLCIHDPRICPLESKQRRQRTPIEPWSDNPRDLSIEGDVLVRLLDRVDSADVLLQMLLAEPRRTLLRGRKIDFDLAEERQRRFVALVAVVNDMEGNGDVPLAVEKALEYMRRVLDIPF